eukprot:7378136-Prymnesium_polylepis.2
MATVEVTEKAECEEGAHPEAAARVEVGREEAAGATATQPQRATPLYIAVEGACRCVQYRLYSSRGAGWVGADTPHRKLAVVRWRRRQAETDRKIGCDGASNVEGVALVSVFQVVAVFVKQVVPLFAVARLWPIRARLQRTVLVSTADQSASQPFRAARRQGSKCTGLNDGGVGSGGCDGGGPGGSGESGGLGGGSGGVGGLGGGAGAKRHHTSSWVPRIW